MLNVILEFILNLLYPPKCMFCGKQIDNKDKHYCKSCYYKLSFTEEPKCLICGSYLPGNEKICISCKTIRRYIDVNYPVFYYDGAIKEALLKHKFCGKMWYYKPFAEFIFENIKDKVKNIDYIVYPPVNNKTFYKRGYNQSELISNELGKMLSLKVLKKCIFKKFDNEKQSNMSGKMRFKNVKGVFDVKDEFKEELKGKTILFVDDVYTTGATSNECAKLLKKYGATSVVVTTLCIVS